VRGIDANLKKARILVTNDDGIHAPGLKVLERVAKSLSNDVWVVAPESEHSGASHALTLRRPLQVHRLGPRRYATSGTPTDCVLIAVKPSLEKRSPDLILSGVNRGANLGEDVIYSGTVAAALERPSRRIGDRLQPGPARQRRSLQDRRNLRAGHRASAGPALLAQGRAHHRQFPALAGQRIAPSASGRRAGD
jgi:hypothetical protein